MVDMKNTAKTIFRKMLHRVTRDEGGVVFIFAAVIFLIVMALFAVTYETARYTEAKMVAQNAADAAAMEMAAWQARGLNVVQEINNDIYEIDTVIWESIKIMGGFTAAIRLAQGAAFISVVGIPVGVKLGKIADGADKVFNVITSGFKIIRTVTVKTLIGMRAAYIYIANCAGYLGAMEAAKLNGATPITGTLTDRLPGVFSSVIDKYMGNFCAAGIPMASLTNIFKLPLEEVKDDAQLFGSSSLNNKRSVLYKSAARALKTGMPKTGRVMNTEWYIWQDPYYRSAGKHYPAWLWVCRKDVKPALILGDFFWGIRNPSSGLPTPMAYAIAMPIGGNVMRHTTLKSRPPGYGAGVEPALVPVSEIKNWNSSLTAFLENLMFMH
jgi:hypothetical protein